MSPSLRESYVPERVVDRVDLLFFNTANILRECLHHGFNGHVKKVNLDCKPPEFAFLYTPDNKVVYRLFDRRHTLSFGNGDGGQLLDLTLLTEHTLNLDLMVSFDFQVYASYRDNSEDYLVKRQKGTLLLSEDPVARHLFSLIRGTSEYE